MDFTKKEVLELIDSLIADNVVGAKIYYKDGKEIRKLVKILKKIDKYRNAILGSDYMVVSWKKMKGRSYKCLQIVLWNGKKVPITKTAIQKLGREWNKRAAILRELRDLVELQIKRFRENNVPSWDKKNVHIDHVISFAELVDRFVEEQGYHKIESLPGKKYYQRFLLKEEIAQEWQAFHKKHAELRAIKPELNLKLGAKGYKSTR